MPIIENNNHIDKTNGHTKQLCIICGDDSDGLHFGKHTCRACAAFFRRTVSLKLEYTCKQDGNCAIEKSARNMCRSCRFQKCLGEGMLVAAVQHSRDGIGKRKEPEKRGSIDSAPAIKAPKPLEMIIQSPTSSTSISDYTPPDTVLSSTYWSPPPLSTSNNTIFMPLDSFTASFPSTYGNSVSPQNLVLNGTLASNLENKPGNMPHIVHNFANLLARPSAFTPVRETEMRVLAKMVEGYQNFLSLRKAGYALVDDIPRFRREDGDIPISNFGRSKQICKIEASLLMDTLEKFYMPYAELTQPDKNHLFDTFYCLFANTERAFRTYKAFGGRSEDDRMIMPDGGYVKLSELEKFYENTKMVKGDPHEVAKVFEGTMSYIRNVVVEHMRRIDISEVELCALSGMFLWRDTVQHISSDGANILYRTRDEILRDLHIYYRNNGLIESEVTTKTAHLFLLIPKIENSVKLFRENFHIAEIFNMLELDSCCKKQVDSND
uniref:Uncharacterized protein n=1 Tax=Acrobeloides nanus TaxID=290746 RepID=A0A914EKR9_9BILA